MIGGVATTYTVMQILFTLQKEKHLHTGYGRNKSLGSNFIKYSWLYFTFSKAMNKRISNKERIFLSLVGPSGSESSRLF